MTLRFPTIEQLKRAIQIEEQIDLLKAELAAVLSGGEVGEQKDNRKGKRSDVIRAKMAAAQQTRRATKKKNEGSAGDRGTIGGRETEKRKKMSPEARAKIAEAQKKRWAASKAGK